MSRIMPVDSAIIGANVRSLLETVQHAFGVTPNLFRVAAQSPVTLDALVSLNVALGRGRLPVKTRESIALAVAEVNGCDYCLSAHTAIGKAAGLLDCDVAAAREGRAKEPKTSAIVRFARNLVKERGLTSDADLAQLRRVGVNDSEILEIIANAVANIFSNYINQVAGTEIDFVVVRAEPGRAV